MKKVMVSIPDDLWEKIEKATDIAKDDYKFMKMSDSSKVRFVLALAISNLFDEDIEIKI